MGNLYNADVKISRNSEIIFSEINGEIVMMSIEKGEYYGVNPIGSRIWELLETPISFLDICDILLKEYHVSKEQCEKEVEVFIEKALDKNIIVIS